MDNFRPVPGRNILICRFVDSVSGISCAAVVAAKRTTICDHVDLHQLAVPSRDQCRMLIAAATASNENGSMEPFVVRSLFPCIPLEGVPILDAMRCSRCYAVLPEATMSAHLSKHKSTTHGDVAPDMSNVKAQRFGRRLVFVDPSLLRNNNLPEDVEPVVEGRMNVVDQFDDGSVLLDAGLSL